MLPTTNQILNVFQGFRMPETAVDEYESKGKAILAEKLDGFVSQNKTLDFIMLGYPMKSGNDRDKVLGKLPDLAEEISLKNFNTFNEKIKMVYAPGINMQIVSDGYAFNDLLSIPEKVVAEYGEYNADMSKNYPVKWFNMISFFNKQQSITSMREKVMQEFAVTPEELQHAILFNPDVNYLYRGMIRFMEEELAVRDFPSRNQQQKEAKKLVREMMLMNEAYSALIAKEFKTSIRLSMHPSVNNGAKYSFQLIPSKKAWASPWHCALLINADGELETIHKKDAIAAGHHIVNQDGRPYFFEV